MNPHPLNTTKQVLSATASQHSSPSVSPLTAKAGESPLALTPVEDQQQPRRSYDPYKYPRNNADWDSIFAKERAEAHGEAENPRHGHSASTSNPRPNWTGPRIVSPPPEPNTNTSNPRSLLNYESSVHAGASLQISQYSAAPFHSTVGPSVQNQAHTWNIPPTDPSPPEPIVKTEGTAGSERVDMAGFDWQGYYEGRGHKIDPGEPGALIRGEGGSQAALQVPTGEETDGFANEDSTSITQIIPEGSTDNPAQGEQELSRTKRFFLQPLKKLWKSVDLPEPSYSGEGFKGNIRTFMDEGPTFWGEYRWGKTRKQADQNRSTASGGKSAGKAAEESHHTATNTLPASRTTWMKNIGSEHPTSVNTVSDQPSSGFMNTPVTHPFPHLGNTD